MVSYVRTGQARQRKEKEHIMKKIINAIRSLFHGNHEAGMATAEYAVGTAAVISFGGILWKLLTDPAFRELLWKLITWLFNMIFGVVGS